MTLEKAIQVLRKNAYGGYKNWKCKENTDVIGESNYRAKVLSPFEAIAIAEKLMEVKTIEEAIKVLNEFRYLNSEWDLNKDKILILKNDCDGSYWYQSGLDTFSVIAIATQYRRM